MNIFLQGLSKEIKEGKHVALIIDNAGWHNSNELVVPDNITLIPLPPYSPELNAMEQVWEWIKKRFLYNQCYADYNDIVDKVCAAWNHLSSNPDIIKSIIHRKWICL